MKFIYWINVKRIILGFLFIDLVSFLSLSIRSEGNQINSILCYSLSIFWILFSYIFDRYSLEKNNINISFFFKEFSKIVIVSFMTFLSISMLKILLLKFGFLLISPFNSLNFLLNQIFVSYFLILLIKIYLLKTNRIQRRYVFVGSAEKFIKLKNLCKDNPQYGFIDLISFEKNKRIPQVDMFILDNEKNNSFLNDFYLNPIILDNEKKVISLTDWVEIYLHRIPTDFLDLNKKNLNFKNISGFNLKIKRLIDVFLSLIVIVITLPLLFVISLLIYFEDFGPIIYFQKRNGYHGEIINIPKFRSMKVDAEKKGVVWATKNDPRVTRVGKFIRAFRLDELPQIILVLKGKMSLIGPRPERPEIDNFLSKEILYYSLRYNTLPGLSGWSQVCYRYGSSKEDSEIKLSYDLFYINNYSLLLDLLIFFKTLKVIMGAQK